MYGAASKLFGIERETAVLGVKLDRLETTHGELKAGLSKVEGGLSKMEAGLSKVEGGLSKMEAGLSKMEGGLSKMEGGLSKIEGDLRYYFFASVILSALILLKRDRR